MDSEMTPDDSKFIADVKARDMAASPGPWKNGKLVWASWSDQVCETSEEADLNDNFAMNARTDIPRLLTIIAERDAEIAALKETLSASRAACAKNSDQLCALFREANRLRKMLDVAKGAIGCAMMEYQDETQSGSESAGKMYVVLDRNLTELDRLEKESL